MSASQTPPGNPEGNLAKDKYMMLNQPFVLSETEIAASRIEALNGSGDAAFKLASFYEMIALDFKESRFWMTVAAENGDIRAYYGLGVKLRLSQDHQDRIRARYWLEKAERDNAEPIKSLARDVLKELQK